MFWVNSWSSLPLVKRKKCRLYHDQSKYEESTPRASVRLMTQWREGQWSAALGETLSSRLKYCFPARTFNLQLSLLLLKIKWGQDHFLSFKIKHTYIFHVVFLYTLLINYKFRPLGPVKISVLLTQVVPLAWRKSTRPRNTTVNFSDQDMQSEKKKKKMPTAL